MGVEGVWSALFQRSGSNPISDAVCSRSLPLASPDAAEAKPRTEAAIDRTLKAGGWFSHRAHPGC